MEHSISARVLRVVTVVALSLSLYGLSACGGAQSRLAGHMDRGREYLAEGSWKKASVEFRNALQIDPKNAEAQLLNGRVSEQLGDLREAVRGYQAAIDLDPAGAAGPAALGRLYVFGGAPERALELVEPALVKHPGDAELLTVRGAARAQQKNLDGALADAEAAVQKNPGSENAVALIASLYRQTQQAPRARAILEKAVAANPKSVDLRLILASMTVETGDNAAAEAQLVKVIELRPDDLAHRTRLALFYARVKRADDAQRVLEAAVKDLPQQDEAKLQLVDFVSNQRSREQGEKVLRDFIAGDPKNLDLKLGLGALLQREKADAEALAVYRELIASAGEDPKTLVARNRMAAMQVAAGDFKGASTAIDETLKINPRDNDALTLRAGLALERHDAPSAIADLRAVLREQPEAIVVRRTLARAHLENREPALAEDVLREAMQVAPHDLAVRVDLAQLLAQTGRAEQSVTLLEDAVRSAPADVPARETLVKAYLASRDFAAALTATEDIKILRPNGASGFYLAGLAQQASGNADAAAREFARAMELQPTAMDALAAYVRLQASRGKIDDAMARARAAAQAQPGNAIARNLLGELLLVRKAWPDAVTEFTAAIAGAPSWAVPYRNLALAEMGRKNIEAGIASYTRGLEPTQYAPELVGDLGSLYERQRKPEAAIELYEQLHKRNPRQQFAANNLAMLLVTYRTDKESLSRARSLTESFGDSNVGSLLDTSGWVRFKNGENQDALVLLERAVSREPGSPVFRFHLAMAQIEAGEHDKARDNLEAALKAGTFTGRDEARAALDSLNRRAG
jgi:tetratricopeptide (TPR) repeat protein